MKTRTIAGLVIVALVVPLSSCPRAPQVSLGVWIFEVDHTTSISLIGVQLGANGMVQTPDPLPPEANTGFANPLSWSQDGSTFTLLIENPGFSGGIVYTGTVDSRTSIIDGMWTVVEGGETGTWSGMKL